MASDALTIALGGALDLLRHTRLGPQIDNLVLESFTQDQQYTTEFTANRGWHAERSLNLQTLEDEMHIQVADLDNLSDTAGPMTEAILNILEAATIDGRRYKIKPADKPHGLPAFYKFKVALPDLNRE